MAICRSYANTKVTPSPIELPRTEAFAFTEHLCALGIRPEYGSQTARCVLRLNLSRQAAEIILKKTVPDLSSMDMTADINSQTVYALSDQLPTAEEWEASGSAGERH